MNFKIIRLFLFAVVLSCVVSCTADNSSEEEEEVEVILNYDYNDAELETLALINDYRVSNGLNALEKNNHVSHKAEEHNKYMMNKNVVNHDGFEERSKNIIKALKAKNVSENIAYNYNSPKGAFDAWLDSPSHKINIVGDYSHIGISIRENLANGKKYYTSIFVKVKN